MPTYVVTGGAGFIGSHIVEALVRRNATVRVLDNFSTGKPQNLEKFKASIEVHSADLTNANLDPLVAGADFVIHQAAYASVAASIADPWFTHQINVDGTVRLLEAARRARVRRFVFASSATVYGDEPALPKTEQSSLQLLSPYGVHKLAGELYCRLYSRAFGLDTVCLRYFNVFGPRQDPSSEYGGVLSIFIRELLKNRPPTIFGDGLQSRDFIYVGDVAEANLLACERAGIRGEVFNIACGKSVSVLDVFEAIRRVIGCSVEPKFAEKRAGDIRHSAADVSLAAERLGFRARYSLDEGLRETVGWHRTTGEP